MWTKRAGDLVAAFVAGNGVLDLIAPRQRVFLWGFGPERLRKLTLWLADHPTAVRLQGIARVGIGAWLALRQYREVPQPSWRQRWFPRYRSAGLLAPVGLLVVAIPLATIFYRRSRSEAARKKGKLTPTVARIIELSATSETSFEDAINEAISRANETLRGVEGAWVKDMNVLISDGQIRGYKVNLAVTFLLEDGD